MKVDKIFNTTKAVKKTASMITEQVKTKCPNPRGFKMSNARVNLELNAERMDAEDYIRIRSYLDQHERRI